MTRRRNTTKGFARAISLMETRIAEAGRSRGFAVSRLLTHWPEVVGDQFAELCTPVKVGYAKGGIGATLTVLAKGAVAPMLEMQKEALLDKVNACYGYGAISRIHITQTASVGFSDGRAEFLPKAKLKPAPPSPALKAEASALAQGAQDDALRASLEALATNFLNRSRTS